LFETRPQDGAPFIAWGFVRAIQFAGRQRRAG